MTAHARTAAAIATFAAVAGVSRLVQAQVDPPRALGVAIETWTAAVDDRSVLNVDSGQNHQVTPVLFGIDVLGHLGQFALGANLDGLPGIFGDGRLSVGSLAGWQPAARRFHLQLLAEAGGHRFSEVGGTFFSSVVGPDSQWLPYAGLRAGVTTSFPEEGRFQMGLWLFARRDIGEATATNASGSLMGGETTYTDYRLGGFQAGVALRIGVIIARRPSALSGNDHAERRRDDREKRGPEGT